VYYSDNLVSGNVFSEFSRYREVSGQGAYQESYSFDKNGNLKTLTRNGSGQDDAGNLYLVSSPTTRYPLQMDNFTYNYYTASGTTTTPTTLNRLSSVSDAVTTDPYTGDVSNGQSTTNYVYNANGQLTADAQEYISRIDWTVTGKVKNIVFNSTGHTAGKKDMKFIYDPMDRRVAKVVYQDEGHSAIAYTYYTYDASGNVMATYNRTIVTDRDVTNGFTDYINLAEHHLYGASRLGVENENTLLARRSYTITGDPETGTNPSYGTATQFTAEYTYRKVSDKFYELSNHLGNVLAVVTDRKVELTTTNTYTADVVSYNDYSPYGMLLQHRHGFETGGAYKYGFQGQEKDDEMKGEGNSYNYEYRMDDPRIGRFFAIDPLSPKYPFYSPYAFSGNRVIDCFELEGLEPINPNDQIIFVLPQTASGGAGGIEINPYRLGWLAEKAFWNQVYDKGQNIGGPNRNIAMYNFGIPFKPSINGDPVTNGPAPLQGGSEERKDYPVQASSIAIDPSVRRQNTGYRRKAYASKYQFRGRSVQTSTPTATSRATGWIGLIIATGELAYTTTETYSILSANDKVNYQGNVAEEAIYDVDYALRLGLIPEEYANRADLAVITNVLMTGTMTKAAQKYIFRSGGDQHWRKADFTKTIKFAKGLKADIKNYEAVVSASYAMDVAGEKYQKVLESLNYVTTRPQ
jgi:RHS repeat-associated protein